MPIAVSRPLGIRRRPQPIWASREHFFTEAALFVFGAASFYNVNVVGSLPGSEVLLFALLPVLLLAHGGRAFEHQYLRFYILAGGWLVGTLIADAYNGIPLFNRAKGEARVVFFILDFVALAIFLNRKTRRIVIFALSIALVLLVSSWQFVGESRSCARSGRCTSRSSSQWENTVRPTISAARNGSLSSTRQSSMAPSDQASDPGRL